MILKHPHTSTLLRILLLWSFVALSTTGPARAQISLADWSQSIFLLPPAPPEENTLNSRSQAGMLAARGWDRSTDVRLLRERDPSGFKRYTLMWSPLSTGSAALQLRARFRKDGRSGLLPTKRVTAVGIAVPWQQLAFELEGVDDRDIGRSLLGTLRWADEGHRLECGLTVPLVAPREISGAVILQFVYRFDSGGSSQPIGPASAAALGYFPTTDY